MWIRKTPEEVTTERRHNRLRHVCGIVLLGGISWCGLSRLHPVPGRSLRNSTVELMCIALVAGILLVWRLSWLARRKRQTTVVCDRCNAVKSADGDLNCKCGGRYLSLLEMKWIEPAPNRPAHRGETADQMLAHGAR